MHRPRPNSLPLRPPRRRRRIPALHHLAPLTLLLAGACGTVAASVTLFKPLGTRQCEAGGPTPDGLAQALRAGAVTVQLMSCGHDGRMRPAVCGAADGRLVIVDVPAEQQARAESLGWRPLSGLPDAVRRPC